MKNRIYTLLYLCVVFLSGCVDALPRESPEEEIKKSAISVEQHASQVMTYAAEARAERERAEKILEEAKKLSAQAEAAKLRCDSALKTIEQRRRAMAAARAAAAAAAETPPPAPQRLPTSIPTSNAPRITVPPVAAPVAKGSKAYSPSDAPLSPEELERLKSMREE